MTRREEIKELASMIVDAVRCAPFGPEVQTASLVTALAVMIEANWRWDDRIPVVDHYLGELRERVVSPEAKRHSEDVLQ